MFRLKECFKLYLQRLATTPGLASICRSRVEGLDERGPSKKFQGSSFGIVIATTTLVHRGTSWTTIPTQAERSLSKPYSMRSQGLGAFCIRNSASFQTSSTIFFVLLLPFCFSFPRCLPNSFPFHCITVRSVFRTLEDSYNGCSGSRTKWTK